MGIARGVVPMPRRGGAAAAGIGAPAPPARRGRRAGTPKRAFFRSSPYYPRPTLGFRPAALLPGDPSEAESSVLPSSARGPLTSPPLAPVPLTRRKQVRAASLQELVYKQGQAGVTKASVSITFNNSDRSRSPVGYEHCDQITVTRQIVIGGRNKYMINGQTAQPTRVQNLFHSVQLNVNNPHFLIMQGRITRC